MSLQAMYQEPCYASFINGSFCFDEGQQEISLISPVIQDCWKKALLAQPDHVNEAINAAETALFEWKKIPAYQRAHYLRRIAAVLIDNKNLLAEAMAMEMGKPVKEGVKEVDYTAGFFSWFAGEAERIYGQIVPASQSNKRLMILHEPVGVCGIITPWNFPLAMPARKIAAALAAGCTMVVKPSLECPVSMLLMAEACRQIGLPKGVLNVIIGPENEVGRELLKSPIVRKISFTGSCEVGKYLYSQSAETLKKLTLELGGQAPLLIFDDADIHKAVLGTITAKFRNNGQTCIAANRILVQKNIYKKYVQQLLEAINNLVIGSPLNPKTDLSTTLHPASVTKVEAHIRDALQKGAQSLLLGQEPFFPTVLVNVTPSMQIFHEETFGPVVAITGFDTNEEGISLANRCEYGLASYVFTENLSLAQKTIENLEFGIIGLNDGLPSTPQASFGGIKNSGFGREGGPSGIKEYLVEKFVSLAL